MVTPARARPSPSRRWAWCSPSAVVVLDAAGRVLVGAGGAAGPACWPPGTCWPGRGWPPGPDGVEVRALDRAAAPALGRAAGAGPRRPAGWGVRSRTLELDTAAGPDDDGVLVVLGRRDLGADPEDVARALRALDPTAVRSSRTATSGR